MYYFFFFNDTATTEIYTLSLHDALPISQVACRPDIEAIVSKRDDVNVSRAEFGFDAEALRALAGDHCEGEIRAQQTERRSEEHTSELQSPCNLVCRLLLEKKKKTTCLRSRPRGLHNPNTDARFHAQIVR